MDVEVHVVTECSAAHTSAQTHRGLLPCTLTPHDQVGGGFIHPARVGRQTGVGPGVGDVRGADEQAAGLEEREAGQLDRAAGQDALP